MKRQTTLAALAALLVAASGCATKPVDTSAASGVAIDRAAALGLVNAFRAENGLKPLSIDETLMRAASRQSAAMAVRDRMDHEVDGNVADRVAKAGYRWGTVAENIAKAQGSYDQAMAAWIRSPGHRRNLLDPRVTQIGFAGERRPGGPPYWTQIFASPSQRVTAPAAAQPVRWGPTLRFP